MIDAISVNYFPLLHNSNVSALAQQNNPIADIIAPIPAPSNQNKKFLPSSSIFFSINKTILYYISNYNFTTKKDTKVI